MKMRVQAPCLNCIDRTLGCHSTCERYKVFQENKSAENQAKRDFLKVHNEHVSYMRDQKTKREKTNR
jgi:hypothetical protein